jgi:hypothetical protein
MNISASANTSMINTPSLEGSAARQDYGVAVAVKINEQVKREGEAVVKLIEEAPKPPQDAGRGSKLRAYA